jgi:hypothetical protein
VTTLPRIPSDPQPPGGASDAGRTAGVPTSPVEAAAGEPAAAAPTAGPPTGSGAAAAAGVWLKEFALYPFFIVLGIVGVFTLFSVLHRNSKDARDYLAEIRGSGGNDRWYAAYQLSNLIGRQAEELKGDAAFVQEVRVLFEGGDNDDPRLQRYLAIVLGRVGDDSVLPALVHAVQSDEDAETRMWSAWAMGAIGAPDGVPALLGALRDPEAGVREMGAYALGSLRDPRSVEPLQGLLQDQVEDVRWNAAIALAQQGDGAGFPILRQLVDSRYLSGIDGMTDERLREIMLNAVKALGVLQATYPSARDLLEETSASAPFPVVQQEARKQLEAAPRPGAGEG